MQGPCCSRELFVTLFSSQDLYRDTMNALKDLMKSLLQKDLTPQGLHDMFEVRAASDQYIPWWGWGRQEVTRAKPAFFCPLAPDTTEGTRSCCGEQGKGAVTAGGRQGLPEMRSGSPDVQ